MENCNCHNIKINTIEKLITDIVTNIGLDTSLCSSQAYNGTGNMSGEQKGATNQLCEITANKKTACFIVNLMNSNCAYQKRQMFQTYTIWLALWNLLVHFQIFGENVNVKWFLVIMKSYLKVSFKERNDDDNSDMSKNSRRVYCRDTTVRKTIFSFSKRFEKMVFPKKLRWNMVFLVLSGKMTFLFPENMILFFRDKRKDDLSQKNT